MMGGRETFPTGRYLLAGCVARHKCFRGRRCIESVVVTRVPDRSVLSECAPTGVVRLQQTRRRGMVQAV